jgi:type IV pilus assembly protein PilQ
MKTSAASFDAVKTTQGRVSALCEPSGVSASAETEGRGLSAPAGSWLKRILAFGAMVGTLLLSSGMPLHASAADTNAIESLEYSTMQGNSVVLRLGFRQPLETEPVGFTLANPPRIALDFANIENGLGRNAQNVNEGVLKSLNIVQAGARTRLVLNLVKTAQYSTRIDGKHLLVTLQGVDVSTAALPTQFAAADATAGATHAIRDIDFRRGGSGEAKVITVLSDSHSSIDIRQQGRTIVVDFLKTSLPKNLQRRLDVSDFGTPVTNIESYALGEHTRMVVEPQGDWEYSAYQAENQFILEVKRKTEADAKLGVPGKPVYKGEKLSLNFQNVGVREVLQVIADFTGLNIIASDTVQGSVTLRLKDVPWDQALDIIMQARGLDKRESGNVVWIAPKDELNAKEKLELESRKALAELEPLITRNYTLNYVRADEALGMLSGRSIGLSTGSEQATCTPSAVGVKAVDTTGASGGATTTAGTGGSSSTATNRVLSPRGSAAFDLKTNVLIVTDIAERHLAVENILKAIDIASRQVMIEARIVIADDQFTRDLGVRLGVRFARDWGSYNVGAGETSGRAIDYASNENTSGTAPPFNVNLPATALGNPGTLGLALLSASGNTLINLELQALEAERRGKIISNPRVITANLKPAVILQGEQIPYQTVSQDGTETEFKDALLCLLVAPQILNNDSIILNVEVTKDARGDLTTAGPAINAKRVKTQVRVNNGETAVLGGIFEQTQRTDKQQVPLLGDLPILGNLFKTTTRQDDKTELLIFLTPKILDERLGIR